MNETSCLLCVDIPDCQPVAAARKNLSSVRLDARVPLRDTGFWLHWSKGDIDLCVELQSVPHNLVCGQITRCIGRRTDPVRDYLLIQVGNNEVFEIVRLRQSPDAFQVFHNGQLAWVMLKEIIGKDRIFFLRFVLPQERWVVLESMSGSCVGTVDLHYPVTKSTPINFVTPTGIQYPIYAMQLVFGNETSRLIPSMSPIHDSEGSERAHFIVAVCLRLLILRLDFLSL